MTKREIAACIDHTFLKAAGDPDAVERLCAEAKKYHFACAMVNPAEVKRAAELHDGNVTLPMISMYRMNNPIKEDINHYEAFHGRYARIDDCDSITLEMAVPIEIEYQVDIWAQYRTQADILFRELFFFLLRDPNLVVDIPEFDESQVFSLKYESMDQSTDYSSFEETYILHRYSITYKVPTARMFYRGKSAKLVHEIPVVMVPYSKIAK